MIQGLLQVGHAPGTRRSEHGVTVYALHPEAGKATNFIVEVTAIP